MRSIQAAASVLALAAALAATEAADARIRDRVHADSFGNLIVYSSAGYKRIIVGKGHLAAQFSEAGQAADEGVVDLDAPDGAGLVRYCYRPPVFVKGRSYMYGLAEGEMPDLWGGCR